MQRKGKEGGNSSSTFETHSTDGRGRRWTRAGSSSRSSRWLGGGSVRSRRSSKKGQEARGMGLQQMVARQKEGRGAVLVSRGCKGKERRGQQQQHL